MTTLQMVKKCCQNDIHCFFFTVEGMFQPEEQMQENDFDECKPLTM